MIFSWISFSCPLILASFGALISEYAGCLAMFMEGLISLAAFLTYTFTVLTHSFLLGTILSSICCMILVTAFSLATEKLKSNKFIGSTALNLFFAALPSFLSFMIFGSRGVLTSEYFSYTPLQVRIFTIVSSAVFISLVILFLTKTQTGLYIRITGSDADVLLAKGINPARLRTLSWTIAALYGSFAGSFLTMRISSFVPNISSGRGWIALAAVFLGKKKPVRLLISVIVFCFADILAANLQNFLPQIPGSVLISFPYLIVLCLILFDIF